VALFIGPNGFCVLNVNFYQSEVYSLFKENGFLHLFAISGSNLILLSMFLEKVLKPLKVFIRTGWVRIMLLVLYVIFIVGLDVIPAVRALLTEFISFVLKSFGLKIEYKYITILLFIVFLLIRVEYVINISFVFFFDFCAG
jgi:predicted membrane metal-binding protein